MFGRKRWETKILVEGEKSAQLVSRIENLPDVNPDYDIYPVEVKSADNTQAKSYKQFCSKYNPKKGIKLSTKNIASGNPVISLMQKRRCR